MLRQVGQLVAQQNQNNGVPALFRNKCAENVVDRGSHGRPRENDNVSRVGDDAEDTHDDCYIAVILSIPVEELDLDLYFDLDLDIEKCSYYQPPALWV